MMHSQAPTAAPAVRKAARRDHHGASQPFTYFPAIDELAQLEQWVISKPVQRRGKIDKPPFSPHTHQMCSHSNPEHWSSYSTARAALAGFAWLGFVFHEADPYSGIDLDGCCKLGIDKIRTRADIEDWALAIIDLLNSYTEVSPSGKGVKIFVRGTLAEPVKHAMGPHKGIEIYSRQRYFTVTGAHLAATPTEIRDAQPALDQLAREYMPAPIEKPTAPALQKQTSIRVTRKIPSYIVPNGKIDTNAIYQDTWTRFGNDHDLTTMLIGYGATQTSAKDFTCPFVQCNHTHRNTLFIYNNRVYSRSPHCVIPMKRGLDSKGLYILLEHANNHNNAYEALAREYGVWIEPKKAGRPLPEEPPEIADRAKRQAYNAKRRDDRRAETLGALDGIYDRVCNASFTSAVPEGVSAEKHSDRAHALFAYLLVLAQEAGRLQVAPTNEQLASDLGFCKRYVVYAFRELEAAGIGKRQGGKGGMSNQPNEAATWTFYREPSTPITPVQPEISDALYLGCKPDCDAECTLSYRTSNTQVESKDLVRGGHQPTQATADPPRATQPDMALTAPEAATAGLEAPSGPQAEYRPEWSILSNDKPYTGSHCINSEMRWALSNEAIKLRTDDAGDVADVAEQIPLATVAPTQPTKRKRKSGETIARIDRYHAQVVYMKLAELKAEKRKLENIIRKHSSAFWVRETREKLALVEAALAENRPQSKTTVPVSPPLTSYHASIAASTPIVQQAGFV